MTELHKREFPMPEYIEAWKCFRNNSDETEVTANFLANLHSWPKKENLDICDVGCGDGRIVCEVLSHCKTVNKVRLIDPDNDMLLEAEQLLEKNFSGSIITWHGPIEDMWPRCAASSDVVLAVHLVYLLEPDELNSLIYKRPKAAATYVIFDSPNSVFTELWQWTASKYYDRSKHAHNELCKYLKLDEPPATRVRSRIPKHLLTDHELSDCLLSILCYRNMRDDVPVELRAKVKEITDRHTDVTGEFVECESVCYELPPLTE